METAGYWTKKKVKISKKRPSLVGKKDFLIAGFFFLFLGETTTSAVVGF